MIGLATVAPAKTKGRVSNLVADLRLHPQGDEIILVDRWPNDQGVAEFLVLESAEDGGCGLFVEIQLRNRLVTDDLDFRLLIIGRDNPRISEKFGVGIFIQEAQGERTFAER